MKGLKARRALRKRNIEKENRVEKQVDSNSSERFRRGREPAPLIKEKKVKVRKVKERDPDFHASDLFMLPSHANKREQLEFKNVGTPDLDLDKVGDDLDMEMAYLEKKLGLNKKKTAKKAEKAMKEELGLDDGEGGDFFSFVDGIVADVEKKTGKKRKIINADELCSDASDEETEDEEEVDLDEYDDEDESQRVSAKNDIDRFINGGAGASDEDMGSDNDEDDEDNEEEDEDDGSSEEGSDAQDEDEVDMDGSAAEESEEEEDIPIPPPGSYVPPHLRKKLAEQEARRAAKEAAAASKDSAASSGKKTITAADVKLPSQLMKDLKISLTGLINRVSEGNLGPVATKLLPLFNIPEAVYVANGTSVAAVQKNKALKRALTSAWEAAVADIAVSAVEKSALSNVQSTKSLVSTQMTLVACVHVVACGRLGPALVQRIAQQVLRYLPSVDRLAEIETLDVSKRDEDELAKCDDEKAMCKWTVTALAVLFDLGLVDSKLLFEAIKLLASIDGAVTHEDDSKTPLPPARVDLLLLLLKVAGPRLRRESPADFKDVLVYLTSRADALTYMTSGAKPSEKVAFESKSPKNRMLLATMEVMGSRVEFLMLELQKLKNNQASTSPFPALHKWLATFPPLKLLVVSTGGDAKGVANLEKFAVSFAKNAANSKVKGNIFAHIADLPTGDVSWSESSEAAGMVGDHRDSMTQNQQTSTEKLLELAKAQRINVDVQKSIFVAVMGAADVDDAIERVSAALHAHASERGGIMSLKKFAPHLWAILMHCAARETKYNPFYSMLTRELLAGAGYMSTASMHQHRANINNLMVDPDSINSEGSSTVHLRRAFRQAFASQLPTLTESQPRRIRALARMFGVAIATVEGVSINTLRFMDWSGSATIASVFTAEVLRTVFNILSGQDEAHAPKGAALGISHFIHGKSDDELDVVLLELFRPILPMEDVKEALILIIQEELQGKLACKRAEQMADLARRLLVAGELPRV